MNDNDKSKKQLLEELTTLRCKYDQLKSSLKSEVQKKVVPESDNKFRMLLQQSPLAIQIFAPNGDLLDANPAWEKMWHVKLEDVLGKHNALHDKQIEEMGMLPIMKRVFQGEVFQTPDVVFDPSQSGLPGQKRWVRGQAFPLRTKDSEIQNIVFMAIDITDQKLAEEKLQKSLTEKTILLQELHHRVKNNLQLIASLLNLQEKHLGEGDVRQVLQESRTRIISIANIHHKLYDQNNFSEINFKGYLEETVEELFTVYNIDRNRIEFELFFFGEKYQLNTAIIAGLLINELITNTLRHAFVENHHGKIIIRMTQDQNCEISKIDYQDNGIGFDSSVKKGLGSFLIEKLAMQLDLGFVLHTQPNQGTQYIFTKKMP